GPGRRGDRHLPLQGPQRTVVSAIQEGAGRAHLPTVARACNLAGARAGAGTNFVAQAAGRPHHREQLALVGEVHLLCLFTVTQPKAVVEPPDRLADALPAVQRAIAGQRVRGGLAREVEVLRGLAAEANVDCPATTRNPLHVVRRLPAADEFQLAEQGR